MKKLVITILFVFILGFAIGGTISQLFLEFENLQEPTIQTKEHRGFQTLVQEEKEETVKSEIKNNQEIPSPSDWVKENNIHVLSDKVIIDVKNPQWARFADTNSMDPVFDAGSNAIEIIPQNPRDIHIGDIVSYDAGKYGTIIHRVIETGSDEKGWYAIFQGDNNPSPDPNKVRWEQIRRLVIAIIY